MFQPHPFLEEIFLQVKNLWKPPFSKKKGEIFSSPKTTSKKWRKRRAAWITSLHSGLPELPPPPDSPTDIISMSGNIHKRFVSKKQLPFLGGEVRYQKIDGKKIYISPNLLGGLSYYPIPLGLVFLTWRHKIRSHKISPVWKPECFLPRPSWV